MHTEKTHQFIKLWTQDPNRFPYQVKQGSIKRDFLSETHKSHGYICQPTTIINTHGWEFLLPHDVEIVWDGVISPDPSHVKIISGEYYDGMRIASTLTGSGTITFQLNCFFETDKDHYIMMSGSPNYFVDGVKPMNALWRSDYYTYGEANFCWKITEPNKVVTFKKGTPIAFIYNYPKDLLESTSISIENLAENKDLISKIDAYAQKRHKFYEENEDWTWGNFYKKGVGPHDEKYLDSVFKINLMEP
jgi:hypothetical protein